MTTTRCLRAISLAAGCGLHASLAFAQATPVLTLADAVDEALAKNERIVNQADTIAQADLGLRLARNTFSPKITPNIFGSFGRTDVSSQTYRVDVSQKLVTGTELRLVHGHGVGADSRDSSGRRPATCCSTTPTPR